MFSVSTVLGDKASTVEQSSGPSVNLLTVVHPHVEEEEDK